MRVYIMIDELWPDYELVLSQNAGKYLSRYEGEYEIDQKLYAEYADAREKFMELRRKIRNVVKHGEDNAG